MLVKLNQFPKDRGEQMKNLFQTKKIHPNPAYLWMISQNTTSPPKNHQGVFISSVYSANGPLRVSQSPKFWGIFAPLAPSPLGLYVTHCGTAGSEGPGLVRWWGFVKNRSMQNNVKKEIHLKVLLTKASRDLDGSKFWKFLIPHIGSSQSEENI